MDTLFVGDIPLDFKYALFYNGYIDLYNQPYGQNSTLPYYRIYLYNDGFYYTYSTHIFGPSQTTFQEIKVSNDWLYRADIDKIFTVCFFCIFLFIFLFNIVTSVFKRGGVFGGLL